jgi:hypothetical protein
VADETYEDIPDIINELTLLWLETVRSAFDLIWPPDRLAQLLMHYVADLYYIIIYALQQSWSNITKQVEDFIRIQLGFPPRP